MKVGKIAETAPQISEIFKRRKLKSYYFTHIDAHIAHTHTSTQTQPGLWGIWVAKPNGIFFFSFVIKQHNLYRSSSTSCDSYHILRGRYGISGSQQASWGSYLHILSNDRSSHQMGLSACNAPLVYQSPKPEAPQSMWPAKKVLFCRQTDRMHEIYKRVLKVCFCCLCSMTRHEDRGWTHFHV